MPQSALGPLSSTRYDTLSLSVSDRIAVCTIERADRLNSLTPAVFGDFELMLDAITRDSDVRVLVIKGAGDVFSVGLDREELDRAFADHDYFRSLLADIASLCTRIENLGIPVIAQVDGIARAGAFEIALACDFLFMSSEARIGDVHTSFGVVSGAGLALRLARAIGLQRAKEVVFSARWIDAEEACATGLAWDAAPREALDDAVRSFASILTRTSGQALRAAKKQFSAIDAENLTRSSRIDQQVLMDLLAEPDSDAHEGFDAFRDGREPRWAVSAHGANHAPTKESN